MVFFRSNLEKNWFFPSPTIPSFPVMHLFPVFSCFFYLLHGVICLYNIMLLEAGFVLWNVCNTLFLQIQTL
ncbi:hypothetical protein RchiOBHm_Chr5g0011201 [Rosa chinensis]|uniref:Uncharacterized protein n=1 Tax=Rosa chinensis TaxID=74649 RepID=A0A2P6Q4V7_ROSCH|nr:hypothetical protein RchiOBHm_Chr5g0011201 [Rosa chinensis]